MPNPIKCFANVIENSPQFFPESPTSQKVRYTNTNWFTVESPGIKKLIILGVIIKIFKHKRLKYFVFRTQQRYKSIVIHSRQITYLGGRSRRLHPCKKMAQHQLQWVVKERAKWNRKFRRKSTKNTIAGTIWSRCLTNLQCFSTDPTWRGERTILMSWVW